MTITSYWIKNDDALALADTLEEGGYETLAYAVRETLDDNHPDHDHIVYASRFEQDMMDLIDAHNVPHETHVVNV